MAGFHHPVENAQLGRGEFAGARPGALYGPGQGGLVANQVVYIPAEHQFVDGVFRKGAPQEDRAHPAGEAAKAEEIHVDAGKNQRQGPEPVLVQGQQEHEAVHVRLVRPQEQQQVIFGQLPQFLQRLQVDVQLALVTAGVDEARQFRGGMEPGVPGRGLDLVQALVRIFLRLFQGLAAGLGGSLQLFQETRVP